MSKRARVEAILDAAGSNESVCVCEPDGEGGVRRLAVREVPNCEYAKIVVLDMEPPPNSVAHLDREAVSRPSEREAPASPGDTATHDERHRGPAE